MSRPRTYKVSAAVRVEQMESELAAQLDALRTEIAENVFLQGTAAKSYCSVQIPKDISYFRAEREQSLKRLLQVPAARPLMSQAEVIQHELGSCIAREYTPESLPLLLHQHYLDRSHQLAQCKHLLMLRWRRFCRHSTVLEQLYSFYKGQIDRLVQEYEDAVQRARRLAVSRERLLSCRVGPNIALSQEDVLIYLQWLVSHLQSLKPVHRFLQVLHYLPASERKDVWSGLTQEDVSSSTIQLAGLSSANGIPAHVLRLDQFQGQLRHLVSHFQLQCDTQDLRTPADETELFRLVSLEFRVVFQKQQEMRALVQYGSSEAVERQLGRRGSGAPLRKEASWVPFVQIKPKLDPWQQKFTKLKEQSSMDELLQNLSSCFQLSDPDRAMEALREHTSSVVKPKSVEPFTLDPKSRGGNSTAQIWTSLYNTVLTSQNSTGKHCGRSLQKDKQGLSKSRFGSSTELLGLEEYLGDGGADSSESRGAFLSLVYLRYLRIRELQNACLNMQNYMRSVERTLTFDTAAVVMEGGEMKSRREEWGWMSAVRRGGGDNAGIGSHYQVYSTPVDYQVHCSEFMEFPEVDNHHDYYSGEGRQVRTQDQRGLFVVYDAAQRDLEELEHTLLLTASYYIQTWSRDRCMSEAAGQPKPDLNTWAGMDVDRLAVLLDLWTCEAAFMESKMQLLNCYFEAYQHITDSQERVAMAQVITDIMHHRPQLDPAAQYCVQAYQDELACLQTHHQLIKHVLDHQIDEQRRYLQRVWRGDERGAALGFGLPLNYTPKHLVTLCGGSPALKSVFLLEVHPSLCLARQVYQALGKAHADLCQLHGAKGAPERVALQQRLLKRALHYWHTQAPLGASYSPQVQKDLFSEVFFEDPLLVRDVGLTVLRSAEEKEIRSERDRLLLGVETFAKLLELVTTRHRLLEAAVESEHLAQLYKALALELGFDDFHLYLRPVQFEFAVLKDVSEQRPMFITALLEDNTSVDRYVPSSLPLAIQELDVNHIGRFSFHTQEAVIQLLNGSGIENLQVTLACQVTQKNALIGAIKQASLCYWAEVSAGSQEVQAECESRDTQDRRPSSKPLRSHASDSRHRLAGSFVSIQLEKTGPRDEMLNAFIKRREATGTLMQNPDEAANTKRKLILEFCSKFSATMSQCCVRAQIAGLYHSLTLLLRDLPTIGQKHFMMGRANEAKSNQESEKALSTDPRGFQQRPRALLSADGAVLLNLWFLPHYTETLLMFRGLAEKACHRALQHTLEIASALHDIVCYTISFARLGNAAFVLSSASQSTLMADWGGTESISAELWDVQQQVDSLCDRRSPKVVGRLLQLRRQVLFLLFDAATRHMIRKTFLATGNTIAYQSVNDNMGHALPLLSDSLRGSDQSYLLPLPQPLEPRSPQAQRLFPWRWFLSCLGRHPLDVWDVPPIEFCMQLCLSGLSERSRQVANGELLGVSLLLEEVLSSGQRAEPLQLDMTAQSTDGGQKNGTQLEAEECVVAEGDGDSLKRQKDPTFGLEQQKGFFLLWKQLETVKETWGCHRLGVQQIHNPTLYQHFASLYRQEIQYPSMRALAQHLGSEREYESLLVDGQPLLPPAGATEVELRTWELLRLLESTECDMIKAVQLKMAKETTLLLSEKARQDTALPTDVWKRGSMKHCPTPERPLIVENFVYQLLSGGQNSEGQVSFSSAHLQECLSALSRDVISRERSNFLFYSQFYEHLLQQETQLLHQREQDVKHLEEYHIQSNDPLSKAAGLCRGLTVELTALRARLAHMEEERKSLQQQLSLQHRQHYSTLVQGLFTTCLQLKSRLDGYHQKMEEDVQQMVVRARREGVDRISRLQRKYGSSKDPQELAEALVQKEAQQDLLMENRQQRALMRKLQALGQWKETVAVGKLERELLSTKQREMRRQLACVKVQLESEQQVALLQQELDALREAMQHSQREVHLSRKQLSQQSQRLLEVEHGCAQEARMRMQLHSSGAFSLQRLQEEAEDRERVIKKLTEQLHTGRRHSQIQLQHSTKELQQVRNKLQQERGLKQEAFQLVSQLQRQVSAGITLPRCSSTPGLAAGGNSRTSPILFLRNSRGSPSGKTTRSIRRDDTEDRNIDDTEAKSFFKSTQSRAQLRLDPSEALLPNLTDGRGSPVILALQRP